MKKTLAILLALIMAASVALVSCDNETSDEGADKDFVDDFDGDFGNDEEEGSDKAEGKEDEDDENKSNTSSTMEAVNDTVYVLYPANIRAKASDKDSVDVNGKAPFGASLTRSEKNNKWSKVTYTKDGATITGYVANDLITTSADAVKFDERKNEDGSAVVTEIKANLGSGINNAVIRKYPLADGTPKDFTVLEKKDFDPGSIVGQIAKGSKEITLVSVSVDGKWAYVKGTGVAFENGAPKSTTEVIEGYTLYSNLAIAGSTSTGNDGGDAIG